MTMRIVQTCIHAIDVGDGSSSVLNAAKNTTSTSLRITTSGSAQDMQIVEDFKNSVPEIVESIVVATIPPTPPPTLPPTYPPFNCSEGTIPVYIRRTYELFASEESFSLYEGPYGLGEAVYNMAYTGEGEVLTTVCLTAMCHTITMYDSYGDGWSSGSSVTFITDNGETVQTYRMWGGRESSQVVYFGGECPTTAPPTPPPTEPPTTPIPTTPVPTTILPTPDLTNCEMYTVERITTRYANQESVKIYVETTQSQPLWSRSGLAGTTVEICFPPGTILIEMSDKYVRKENRMEDAMNEKK